MYNTAEQLLTRIDNAKDQIRKLFLKQCTHGRQTISLPNPLVVAACGQFLNVPEKSQRGLHGTAAAIRVLGGDTSQETVALVSKMVEYIRHRDDYEPSGQRPKCKRDGNNVVKLSEAVIALQPVPAASDVVAHLAQRLRTGFKQGQGWSWFIDKQEVTEPFPTAFACYALSRIGPGKEVDGARQYLLRCLQQNDFKNGFAKRHADTMTDVFCLYVLTVLTTGQTTFEERQILVDTFDRTWQRLEPLLDDDLEQNIEYWDGPDTCYVRIPWQPYLLALASHYRIHWKFSSWAAQTKLVHILDMVKGDGYVYPYSGKSLSSRTYAILYEALEMIHRNIEHKRLLVFSLLCDRAVRLLRTRSARTLVFVLVTAALAYIGYQWYQSSVPADYPGIFGNILAAWLLSALSWAQSRR
ncbi:MAG: hypothetical protein Q7J31_07870 [Syntrophales bacterium]|nr:hypothetical protein [Syntrophales bacterium]